MAKITQQQSVGMITEGLQGSGKSITRGVMNCIEFLITKETGKFITNVPLYPEKIYKFIKEKYKKDVTGRIIVIDMDTCIAWKKKVQHPVDYIMSLGDDLVNAHILFDEAHHFCGTMMTGNENKSYRETWVDYLGEIRHDGTTIEFMTQSRNALHKIIKDYIGSYIVLTNLKTEKDPLLGINFTDWFHLRNAIEGVYYEGSKEWNYIKMGRGEKYQGSRIWNMMPVYFEMYNSFSAGQGKHKGTSFEEIENFSTKLIKEKGRLAVVFWFLKKNFFNFFWGSRTVILAWIAILIISLMPFFPTFMMSMFSKAVPVNKNSVAVNKNKSEIKKKKLTEKEKREIKLRKKGYRKIIFLSKYRIYFDDDTDHYHFKGSDLRLENGLFFYKNQIYKIGSFIKEGVRNDKKYNDVNISNVSNAKLQKK